MPALHLTFDDGPERDWTVPVLQALTRAEAHATFFVLGCRAERRPDLVARARRAGHRVELHGYDHLDHRGLEGDAIAADVERALETLDRVGVRPRWWRTPWGMVTDDTRRVAREHGLALVGWDADTHDWRGDDPDEMLRAIAGDAPDGGIVLAHDGLGPGARRSGCPHTVAMVEPVARWARERDLALTSLPDPEDLRRTAAHAERAR